MFWKKKRMTRPGLAAKPATFDAGQLTLEHVGILKAISSPWSEANRELILIRRTPANAEAAFKRAFRGLTVAHLAEYRFVTSHPAAESRALLIRGRSEFTKAAMAFVETMLPLGTLSQLVADGGALLIPTMVKHTSSVPSTPM